jgi:sugar lactone lactonase YvrE
MAMTAAVRELAGGLFFGEGPRWHQGKLWFSDFYDHAVKTVDEDGVVETKFTIPGQPSGLGWLPDGRMLVVSMHERSVLRTEYGHFVVHADLSPWAPFHCNDMVVDASGRAYVGNFGFDLDGCIRDGTLREAVAEHPGTTLVTVQTDGTITVAADGLMFPNGMVITSDGTTLVVAETLGQRLTAFDIEPDGTLTRRRVWAALPRRSPDGICLDSSGAIWVADARRNECIRVAEGGGVLQVVDTGQPCYACALGGTDGHTLFMLTAASSLPEVASADRTGRIMVTEVAHPAAELA